MQSSWSRGETIQQSLLLTLVSCHITEDWRVDTGTNLRHVSIPKLQLGAADPLRQRRDRGKHVAEQHSRRLWVRAELDDDDARGLVDVDRLAVDPCAPDALVYGEKRSTVSSRANRKHGAVPRVSAVPMQRSQRSALWFQVWLW